MPDKLIKVEMDDSRFDRKMKNATSAVKYAMRVFRKHGIVGSVYQTQPGFFPLVEWDYRESKWKNMAGLVNREWFECCEKLVNEEPLQPGDWCYKNPQDANAHYMLCDPKDRKYLIGDRVKVSVKEAQNA